MCGIAGSAGQRLHQAPITRMINVMRHRGPDAEGYYRTGDAQLGHCRLSINDLSEEANQPFVSRDGSVAVVVNGEIYNFKDIKDPLVRKGSSFRSNSDCEVILHAYLDRGLRFIPELNGMFAVAIWDARVKQLFLVRDRLGIKPLYYTQTGAAMIFASEIKALAACDEVSLSLDLQAFGEYLVFENYFGSRTLNENIKMVEPGQIVSFDPHNRTLTKNYFWQPIFPANDGGQSGNIYDRYLQTIETSVNRHLLSDVPLGCYLSAGIDSASVTYYTSQKLNGQVKTFTGYFGIDGFYDEATAAKQISEQIGCPNERVDISPRDFTEHIEDVLYHMDEPRVGMGSFSQYMVARKASREVKVILTGHGGDEFYAGYPVFKAVYGRQNVPRLLLSSSPRELLFFVYFSILPIFRKELRYFMPNIFSMDSLGNVLKDDFHNELMRQTRILEEPEKLREQSSSSYEHLFLTYLKFYLPALFVVEDKISMAFSLESRTPLCDNEMLDLALQIPLSEKLRGQELKHIPRLAMKGKLPAFLFSLPKRGFPTPLRIWFRRESKEYLRSFILDNFSELDTLFRRKTVERLIREYQESLFSTPYDEIKAHRLWMLLNLVAYFKNQRTRYRRDIPAVHLN